jgi:hypothetical protein
MPTGWITCQRCDPDLTAEGTTGDLGQIGGASGVPTFPNTCPACNILFIRFTFISKEVADLIVGNNNHTQVGDVWQTETWCLFYDAGDYTRDVTRPVACTVSTIVHPDDATLDIITSVDVNNGAFVWTRDSNDPASADFLSFSLTTGEIDVPVCGCGSCVGIYMERHRTPFAWEYPPEDFTATVTLDSGTEPPCAYGTECPDDFTTPICLAFDDTYSASLLGIVDGWGFGGRWRYGGFYLGTSDYHCTEAAVLTITGELFDTCDNQENGQFVAANLCCEIRLAWEDCDRDPRTPPDEDDFTIELSDTCTGGSLDSLTYGGTCEPDGGRINCPPDDCPVQYCEFEWDVDNEAWVLLDSNCIHPAECPDAPTDPPPITDVAWVQCLCCETTGPGCTCDDPLLFEPCATQDCIWIWTGTWDLDTACSDITCECQGKPDNDLDPGTFMGETRDGCCCIEI